jgi:hypothetical protein
MCAVNNNGHSLDHSSMDSYVNSLSLHHSGNAMVDTVLHNDGAYLALTLSSVTAVNVMCKVLMTIGIKNVLQPH